MCKNVFIFHLYTHTHNVKSKMVSRYQYVPFRLQKRCVVRYEINNFGLKNLLDE